MDLDPMINTSQDENDYSDYDNRPIRPMDQDALNEALARLPILVDEDELAKQSDPNTSIRTRRQPVLAYSTRRKNFSDVNNNQTVLNTTETPINNKRKLVGCTATNKLIKQLDSRQDLINLKEENKTLEEAKISLELECALLKQSHETELETLKQEHDQAIESLIQEHHLQCEELKASIVDKEQLLVQTNIELENLRNDHTMLLIEKDTLDNIVAEYQIIKEEMNKKLLENETIITKLQEEITNMKNIQQQKQVTTKTSLANGRMPIKEKSTNRVQTINNPTPTKKEPIRAKPNTFPIPALPTTLNKSTSSTCSSTSTTKPPLPKSKVLLDSKKKSVLTDKQTNITSKPSKPKTAATKPTSS